MTLSLSARGALTFFFLIGASIAFCPASLVPKATKIVVRQGTNNDDFLGELSDAEDKEQEGTYTKFNPGDEEEKNEGGTRFQQMMKAAEAAKADFPPSLNISTDSSPSPQSLASQTMENMSVDQQAAMFRAMMQQQQEPSQNFSPQTKSGGVDDKGRKIGRNRDADTIANTADLYFAQLKRDSAVRTMARIQGDDEAADQIFKDDGVIELKDQIKKNPHLEREKEESKSLIETVAEDMRVAEKEREELEKNRNSAGPSYKKMLEAKRKNKVPIQNSAPVPVAVVTPPPAPEPVTVVPPPPAPEPVTVVPPPPAPEPVAVMQPLSKDKISSSPTLTTPQVPQSSPETDNMKSQIRTLMGMFLKHRGGAGFGSGRLRGKEIDNFEILLKKVGMKLRQEAGTRQSPVLESPTSVDSVPKPSNVATPPEPTVTSTSPTPVAPQPAIDIATQPVHIPPPPTPEVAAMTTVNPTLIDPAVQTALQCVEGAIQMYKNSPPDLAPGMLMAVRAAMLNAAEKCKLVIEDDFVQNEESESYPGPTSTSATDQVQQSGADSFSNVTPITAFSDASTHPSDLDSNSALLRKVYDALGNASGDGKFGLGPITSEEASNLAGLVYEMRDILMEELDTGIPIPSATEVDSVDEATFENTTSKYQQMLAKARADKKQ